MCFILAPLRMNTPMANDHPFQVLFETLGRVPAAHADSVNRQAYEILSDILTVPVEKPGRCVLLRAPRAGHGKTHLLSRIQHQLGASHEFVPLHASFGCRIDAASVMDDTLRRLVRQLPASGGLTVLDLITRRLFASALQPLVASGEVPCQDREGALSALRNRPIETFDFHHPNAVTAHWAQENFEVLGQRLSTELSQRCNLPVSGISFWVNALFHFAAAPLENSNRVRILAESVHTGLGMEMERLEALLGLVTQLMRVVLVADDLEGFSADETAALRLAAFLGSLRQSVERLDVILSLNQDIWQSAFVPRLSGGLADRLSEVVVELEPLTEPEMEALLNSRVPGLGRTVLDRIDVTAAGTHARGLIRAAGMAWLKATAADSGAAAVVAPVVIPAALELQPPAVAVAVETPVESEPVVQMPPEAESPAFTFSSAPIAEAAPEWPAPVFSPPAEQEVAAEPWSSQPTTPESLPEPYGAEPVGTPFVPARAWMPPASETTVAFEAAVESPQFLAPASGWQETPVSTPAYSPAAQEPFIVPVTEFAPVDSPFQSAPQTFAPEPPAPSFPQGGWQETVPSTPPQGIFVSAPHPEPMVDSPFQFASEPPAPAFQTEPQPVFNPPPPAETTPSPTTQDTDRVDDLLRQFRERYGRGSL
jgi:hypothetical protein